MKKYLKYFLVFAGLALMLSSCEEEEKIWTGFQVGFERATANLMIPKDVTTTQDGEFKVSLIAVPQKNDVTVTFEIDTENSTAIEGTHFTMSSNSITIPAGESFGVFTVTALNSGFTFGGEFKILELKITESTADVAVNYSTTSITISKEAFIDAFNGSFEAREFYPPDPDPAYGPYLVTCAVVPGTNNITLIPIYDWATQPVVIAFNPDPANKTLTVALQVFNPGVGAGLAVEGTGVYDDEEQTFEINATIYNGASVFDEVTFRYQRPSKKKSLPISKGKGEFMTL